MFLDALLVMTGFCQEARIQTPNAPFGPNLTPGGNFGNWSPTDFIKSMHKGITPEGKVLSKYMPWLGMRNMSDMELLAVYNYLMALPALKTPAAYRTE